MEKMGWRLLTVSAAVLVFLAGWPLPAAASAETEPNGGIASATAIALNEPATGSISDENDVDWYKFTLTTAGKVTLTLKHSTLGDSEQYWGVTCYAFNANTGETSELTSFLVRGTQLSIDGSALGLPAGTYYVQIAPCESSWNTPYSLTASFTASSTWERESNNTLPTANAIALNRSYSGAIATQGDEDWYKFTLTTAGKVTLTFKHSTLGESTQYWAVTCYTFNANTGETSELTSFLVRGAQLRIDSSALGLPAGTYYVKIAPCDSSWSTPYSLTASFTTSSTWERESNNTLPTANAISLNRSYSGALAAQGDKDWYKFTLNTAGKVTLAFQHSTAGEDAQYWRVECYAYNANTGAQSTLASFLARGSELGVSSNALGLPAGTYYVQIAPYESTWGTTYSL